MTARYRFITVALAAALLLSASGPLAGCKRRPKSPETVTRAPDGSILHPKTRGDYRYIGWWLPVLRQERPLRVLVAIDDPVTAQEARAGVERVVGATASKEAPEGLVRVEFVPYVPPASSSEPGTSLPPALVYTGQYRTTIPPGVDIVIVSRGLGGKRGWASGFRVAPDGRTQLPQDAPAGRLIGVWLEIDAPFIRSEGGRSVATIAAHEFAHGLGLGGGHHPSPRDLMHSPAPKGDPPVSRDTLEDLRAVYKTGAAFESEGRW